MTGVTGVRFAHGRRIARLLGALLSAQALVQVLGLLSGFFLLRWLSVEDYAQYTVAFGFSATLGALIDLGFTGAVMPLVGARARDPGVFGAYVRAALHLRGRLAAFTLPLSAIAFFALTSGRGWGIGLQIGLFATVALSLLARTMVDIFALPLLMNNAYRSFYSSQVSTSGLRLAAHGLLFATRGLTSVSASLVNAVSALINGVTYRRSASHHIDLPAKADAQYTREIRRMVAPALPGLLFSAFQGQITVLLVSAFGRVESIAEVGALSRLGALFAVVGGINQVLIAPRFPQVPRQLLVRQSAMVIGAAAALGIFLAVGAFTFPEPLLFLLGPAYDNLRSEVAWYIVSASLMFLAGVLYAINLARRFIWWWTTALGLGLIVLAQLASAALFDLGSTLELQYFATVTGLAACLGQFPPLLHGLRSGPRII